MNKCQCTCSDRFRDEVAGYFGPNGNPPLERRRNMMWYYFVRQTHSIDSKPNRLVKTRIHIFLMNLLGPFVLKSNARKNIRTRNLK